MEVQQLPPQCQTQCYNNNNIIIIFYVWANILMYNNYTQYYNESKVDKINAELL